MGKTVLISDSIRDRSEYLSNCTLPQNYMGDYSVMGFVVNRYSDSRSLLESAGYQLIEKYGATTIPSHAPPNQRKKNPANNIFFHSCRLPSFVILGLYEICQSTATLKDNKELEKT